MKNKTTWTNINGSWRHGKTKTIRVPIALAEKIFDYARYVDNNPLSTQKNPVLEFNEVFQTLEDFIQIKRKQSLHDMRYPEVEFKRDKPTWMIFNEFYRWVKLQALDYPRKVD